MSSDGLGISDRSIAGRRAAAGKREPWRAFNAYSVAFLPAPSDSRVRLHRLRRPVGARRVDARSSRMRQRRISLRSRDRVALRSSSDEASWSASCLFRCHVRIGSWPRSSAPRPRLKMRSRCPPPGLRRECRRYGPVAMRAPALFPVHRSACSAQSPRAPPVGRAKPRYKSTAGEQRPKCDGRGRLQLIRCN